MTNTLHRVGDAQSLSNDYIVFALPARGINDGDCAPKLRRFLEIALRHDPINVGDARHGAAFQPDKTLTPRVHWFRPEAADPAAVLSAVDGPTTVAAVFDTTDKVVAFIRELREAKLGISVNISAKLDDAQECAKRAGIARHSVEYSLGFFGPTDRMSSKATLELATMCGHGMISPAFVDKWVMLVKQGRRTPEQAAACLARFCGCGIFNPARAVRLLETLRSKPG
jgi:hypothetical protein